MTHYRVTISHDACTTHDVEAGSPEDAVERAMDNCGSVSLCHHCSDELEMGDPIHAACVENLDDGTHTDAVDPEVAALKAENQRLKNVVAEVHAWAVCACITTPEDMAQNFPRIIEITGAAE